MRKEDWGAEIKEKEKPARLDSSRGKKKEKKSKVGQRLTDKSGWIFSGYRINQLFGQVKTWTEGYYYDKNNREQRVDLECQLSPKSIYSSYYDVIA